MNKGRIVNAGSANTDVVLTLSRMLAQGECVMVDSQNIVAGGKGANRAVALARLGENPVFSCCIGRDTLGDSLYSLFVEQGIDTSLVLRTDEAGTGTAYIMLDREGNNRIAVYPGANNLLAGDNLSGVIESLDCASFLALEFEIPLESVERLNYEAQKREVPVVIDAGPIRDGVGPQVFKGAYILSPNESEAESLTGINTDTDSGAAEACRALYALGVSNVIIKLGSRGSILFDGSDYFRCMPVECKEPVVDTTGAGDSYMAGLLSAMNRGCSIQDAMRYASAVASIAITRFGAVPSMPYLNEVNQIAAINNGKVSF